MIISYRWLSDFLPQPIPVEKLSAILTSIGLEVEHIEPYEAVKGGLEGLIIGEVLTAIQHPNADKLKLTTVNTGDAEPLKIVCGAPNVAAGQKVIVAPVGSTVHPLTGEPFKIKKAKIRGEESEGMICAEDEIGLGDSHAGIMVLPDEVAIGTLAKDYFNIGESDYSIHIGLTPNRSDAASHLGVARDVCAWLSHHEGIAAAVKYPVIKTVPRSDHTLDISIEVADAGACPRYEGLCMDDVKVAPSPDWMKARLGAIGLRSINNAVDVTNYILHTWGQPLHAFDYDNIRGQQIKVQTLPAGTSFTTLDGKARTLTADDLMICDAEGGMCLAGIFGGVENGITDGTTRVFLECAAFNPKMIRRSSMHHGLRTDAATHFEKGVDVNNLALVLLHAEYLMAQLCGAQSAGGLQSVWSAQGPDESIYLSYEYLDKLSGNDYDAGKVKAILTSLGFTIESEEKRGLSLITPSYKHDIAGPADVVEEILRIDGLDNVPIPSRLNISLLPSAKDDRAMTEKVAALLCGEGFSEIITNSISNSVYYKDITELVNMKNSLSAILDCLRPRMLESGLEVIAWNASRQQPDLLFFDFGNIYTETAPHQYAQSKRLALYATGHRTGKTHTGDTQPANTYFLKSVVQNIVIKCGVLTAKWTTDAGDAMLSAGANIIARISKTTQAVLSAFDIRQPVCYADIDWDALVSASKAATITYSEISKHPVVQRDLAVVVDRSIKYEQLEITTAALKLTPLQSFRLFDVFESEKLGKDKKSLALSFSFNLPDRTLTDAETDAMMQKIRKSYETTLSAQIRE